MIQIFIVKLIISSIQNAIKKKRRIKGLGNLVRIDSYVNKPNELDVEVEKMWKEINKLKKDTHPMADWVCLECGCNATRKAKKK